MRRNKVINGIIGLAFIVMFINIIPVAEQAKGETTSMVELGIWDGQPVFPGTADIYEGFENNTTGQITIHTLSYGTYYHDPQYQIIEYPADSDNHILYFYNQTDNGDGYGQYCEMYVANESYNSVEFDYYAIMDDSYDNMQLIYFYFGGHNVASTVYDNATGSNLVNRAAINFYGNGTVWVSLSNVTTKVGMWLNYTEGDVFHFAFGKSWTVADGLIEYVYTIQNDKAYLYYVQNTSIVSEPSYLYDKPSMYLLNAFSNGSGGQYLKQGFDNFKFYNETWTIEEIQGYTRSPLKGLVAVMPALVVLGMIPVVIGLVRRF